MLKKPKKLFLAAVLSAFLMLGLSAFSLALEPTSDFYVNDFAGVISSGDKSEIMRLARTLEKDTGAQVVIVTIESLEGADIRDFGWRLGEQWGVGSKEGDNGVLIILSVGDRLSSIEVGYGLEGAITDLTTGRIQDDYMLPLYREGDYSGGLLEGCRRVCALIYQEYGITPSEDLGETQEDDSSVIEILGMIFMAFLIFSIFGFTRSGWAGGSIFMSGFGRGGRSGGSFSSGGGGFGGGGFRGGGGSFGGGGSSRGF